MKILQSYSLFKFSGSLTLFMALVLALLVSCESTTKSNEGESSSTVNMEKGWTAEDSDTYNKVKEDLVYGKDNHLDFSNADHYNFYVRQFINAGVNSTTNPHLFEVLSQMRDKAQMKIQKGSVGSQDMMTTTEDDDVRDTINQVTQIGTNDGLSWSSGGLSSVPGGTEVSHLVLSLYDNGGNQIGTNSVQQYNNGDTLSITSAGSVSSDQPVSATLTYFYQTKTGVVGQGTHTLSAQSYPTSVTNGFPVDSNAGSPNQILICLHRTVSGTCDYWIEESSPFPVKFPINGNITYSDAIDTPFTSTNSFAYINLVDEIGGGGCEYTKITNFFDNVTISNDAKTLTWNIPLANFGSACSGNMNPVIYTMYFEVTAGGETVPYTISSSSSVTPGRNAIKLPPMEIAYGCLAAGTEITMADGSPRPIEEVKVGEFVKTQDDGILKVTSSVIGREKTIYRIRTKAGEELMASEEHPFPMPDGNVLLTKELEVGMILITQAGESNITMIDVIDFPSEYVFNLYVNNETGDLPLNDRLFYANGLLVGDNEMQKVYSQRYVNNVDNIRRELDEAWLPDFENYTKSQGK